MANRKVYVTGSASGTPGTDGATYASLSAAITGERDEAPNLADDNCVLSIEISLTSADTTRVTINGFATSETYYLNIYTTAAARHAGVWSDSKYRLEAAPSNGVLEILDDYVRVDGLQILTTGTGAGSCVYCTGQTNGASVWVSNSILRGNSPSTGNSLYLLNNGSGDLYAWNIIGYGIPNTAGRAAQHQTDANGSLTCYNCTFIGAAYGIRQLAGTVTAKNCYIGQTGTASFNGTVTQSYCATEDTGASGTGAQDSVAYDTTTFISVTPATDGTGDYLKPKLGSTLIGNGDTAGGAAPLNYTTDIAGTTRS